MNIFKQISVITAMNIESIPKRWGGSVVIVIGIAGVVGVLVAMLSLTTGMLKAIDGNARPDRAVVLSESALSPTNSSIPRSDVLTIMQAPGVKKDLNGEPLTTSLMLIPIELRDSEGKRINVPLVGIGPKYFGVNPETKLIEGRMFEPGVREVIVGKKARANLPEMDIGDHVVNRQGDWTIVGVYESNGDFYESYLMSDVDTVMSAYNRTSVQSVTAMLISPDALTEFTDALANNPALKVKVTRESEFLEDITKNLNGLLSVVTYGIGTLMAVGAAFGAVNTMYSAVSSRSAEIATLRAIGFGGFPVIVSVLTEALLLALSGGVAGAAIAWMYFDGNTVSSGLVGQNVQSDLTVTPAVIATGLIWALALGAIGGLFPAIRAARLPVATALQVR